MLATAAGHIRRGPIYLCRLVCVRAPVLGLCFFASVIGAPALNPLGAQGTFHLDSGLPGAIDGAFRAQSFALLPTAAVDLPGLNVPCAPK